MAESYIFFLCLGFALGGAVYAYITQKGKGLFVLVGLPLCFGLAHLFLPLALPWSTQLALLLGYMTMVQLWWQAPAPLALSEAEQTEIRNALGHDVFSIDGMTVTTDRVICSGKFKTDRYGFIQQKLQERVDEIFPSQFHVVLCQELFQAPGCQLLPVGRNQPFVLGLSRFLAMVGAILLTQSDWLYTLGLLLVLGGREWTRARIGSKLRPLPLLTMPGSLTFPILGMGRGFATPPPDRKLYFWLGMAPAAVGLGLSLVLLGLGWLVSAPGTENLVLKTWLVLGVDLPPWGRAGWDGLMITALGLLPIGFLEGGHLVHSLMGYSQSMVVGRISRVLFFALTLSHYQALILPGLLLLLLDTDRLPALNDLEELPESYDLLGIGMLGLGIFLLFPGV